MERFVLHYLQCFAKLLFFFQMLFERDFNDLNMRLEESERIRKLLQLELDAMISKQDEDRINVKFQKFKLWR